MQSLIKKIIIVLLMIYTMIAFINPKKIYVDRFLMEMNFPQWVFLQFHPSMYSTEIIVTNLENGTKRGIIHHPMNLVIRNKNIKIPG